MSEVAENVAVDALVQRGVRDGKEHGGIYPGARRVWAKSEQFGGMPDWDVARSLSMELGFDSPRTFLAVRILDTVIRGLEVAGHEVTASAVRHHLLQGTDRLLEQVIARWFASDNTAREPWEHQLKAYFDHKDQRRVVAMVALYRDLVSKGRYPDELVDWLVTAGELSRDEYLKLAAIALDIRAYCAAGRAAGTD